MLRGDSWQASKKHRSREYSEHSFFNVLVEIPRGMLVLFALLYLLRLTSADNKWVIYVNEGNRSTEVPGVLSPLLLLNWTNSQRLSSEDKLQVGALLLWFGRVSKRML